MLIFSFKVYFFSGQIERVFLGWQRGPFLQRGEGWQIHHHLEVVLDAFEELHRIFGMKERRCEGLATVRKVTQIHGELLAKIIARFRALLIWIFRRWSFLFCRVFGAKIVSRSCRKNFRDICGFFRSLVDRLWGLKPNIYLTDELLASGDHRDTLFSAAILNRQQTARWKVNSSLEV